MPTPAQRQHFVKRLEAARAEFDAAPDAETRHALQALVEAYEALIAEIDHIDRIKQDLRTR